MDYKTPSVTSWYCISLLYCTVAVVQSVSCVWLLWPHGLEYTRLLCPLLSPRVCSNSCPLDQCYLTISSSATPFSLCLQCFPGSGFFPMSWLFTSSGQSIKVSASAPVLPMSIQDGSPLGWTSLISLVSNGLSRALSSTTVQKLQFFGTQLSHVYMTARKITALTRRTFFGILMSLLFNMLSRFVIAFLWRSKHLLIAWLQSPFTVILEPKKIKFSTTSTFFPSICHEVMGLDAMIFAFGMLSFKPAFSHSSFFFIKYEPFLEVWKVKCFIHCYIQFVQAYSKLELRCLDSGPFKCRRFQTSEMHR